MSRLYVLWMIYIYIHMWTDFGVCCQIENFVFTSKLYLLNVIAVV